MEAAIAIAVVAALIVANALATWIVVREPYSEPHQKLFQCVAVWLVPVLGAIFIFALHRKPEKASGRYRESPDPQWDNITSTKGVGRSVHTDAAD